MSEIHLALVVAVLIGIVPSFLYDRSEVHARFVTLGGEYALRIVCQLGLGAGWLISWHVGFFDPVTVMWDQPLGELTLGMLVGATARGLMLFLLVGLLVASVASYGSITDRYRDSVSEGPPIGTLFTPCTALIGALVVIASWAVALVASVAIFVSEY